MFDVTDMIESLLLRCALLAFAGLVAWTGSVVLIGLAASAAYSLSGAEAFNWASDNVHLIALMTATLGCFGWLRLTGVSVEN